MPSSSIQNSSLRRQTRLRREYLYRKSLEGRDRVAYEQKRVVRETLASGKALPTEVIDCALFITEFSFAGGEEENRIFFF